MKTDIILSGGAVRAVVRSVLSGPNCIVHNRIGLSRFLDQETDLALSDVAKYLDNGPDSFLIIYAVTHQKRYLEASDVVQAYALDHIMMVRVGERKFLEENGNEGEYFKPLVTRKFRIEDDRLPDYLYSCLGKVGKIVERNGRICSVQTGDCFLRGIVVPDNLTSEYVAIHFATAISEVAFDEYKSVKERQMDSPWVKGLVGQISSEIDYANFPGGNLTDFAQKNLRLL